MPTKTTKTTVKKGTGLKRKVGPLPVWAILTAVGIVLIYIYMRKKRSSQSGGIAENASGFLSPTVTPQQAASAGAPASNSAPAAQLDPSVLEALGGLGTSVPPDYATQTDLDAQIKGLNDSLTAAIAAATFQGASVASTKTSSAKATKTVGGTATKTAPKKYYTFAPGKAPKGQKKLEAPKSVAGKKLHFTKGKGYYYA